MFQPPSAQSVAEMRTNSGKRSGHTARTASATSSKQPDAIVEAAAVIVGAVIRERRQKFMQQVAVGGMNLNKIESGLKHALRCTCGIPRRPR